MVHYLTNQKCRNLQKKKKISYVQHLTNKNHFYKFSVEIKLVKIH